MDHTHTLPFLSIIPYKFKMFLLDNTFLIPIFLFISIYCILSKLSDIANRRSDSTSKEHQEPRSKQNSEQNYKQDYKKDYYKDYKKQIFREPENK